MKISKQRSKNPDSVDAQLKRFLNEMPFEEPSEALEKRILEKRRALEHQRSNRFAMPRRRSYITASIAMAAFIALFIFALVPQQSPDTSLTPLAQQAVIAEAEGLSTQEILAHVIDPIILETEIAFYMVEEQEIELFLDELFWPLSNTL